MRYDLAMKEKSTKEKLEPGSVQAHETYMKLAIEAAKRACHLGEVPIGAVLEYEGEIIGTGFNQPIRALDPSAHAEIGAIRQAARQIDNYRLTGATLYVTVEPCLMCLGAILQSRIGTLVYGASEPKFGAIESIYKFGSNRAVTKGLTIVKGVLEEPCRKILQDFFKYKRDVEEEA